MTDAADQEIAWIFIQHGQWEESGPEVIMEGDRLEAIEFTWEPRERLNQGFEMIGTLSNMFARYYAEHTIDEREIVQLRAPLRPNWFAPLVSSDRISEALPLWKMIQQADYSSIE
ncbi:MAG: hypothetical protein H7Z12_07415 [Rhodospirillaceae bacterium]|nr:hypothetical protein [Rhodospirillales bacterium]